MLIVNLLNGVLLASVVCLAVGVVLLVIFAARSAESGKNFPSRVQAVFRDPRFRIAKTLITVGGMVAVASFVAVFVLSASLPRCAESPENIDEAVAMCMPAAPAPAPAV